MEPVLRLGAGPLMLAGLTWLLWPFRGQVSGAAVLYVLVATLAASLTVPWMAALDSLLALGAFTYAFLPPGGWPDFVAPADRFVLISFLVAALAAGQTACQAVAGRRRAQARAERARRLLELGQSILGRLSGPADSEDALAALAGECGRALGADRAFIQTWDPDAPPRYYPAGGPDGWPAAAIAAAAAAVGVAPPKHHRRVAVDTRTHVLVTPIGRRSTHPAVLIALGGPGLGAELADAVGGVASLALEQSALLHQLAGAEALRQSDELKSALLSSVSHELRTPLAAIRVAATALQRPDVWADREGRSELLGTIDEESEHLNRVIANLLCMSRVEAGTLAPDVRPSDVEELVWEGMRQVGKRLEQRRVHVAVPEGLPAVSCDVGLAGLVLANILDNAAKYAPPDSPITIGARVSPDGGLVATWVDDTGPGVPPGEATRIFDRFYRPSGGQRSGPRGTGLGLSIARAVVEAQGGRIWYEARPGGGARFTVTWPVAAGNQMRPNGRPGPVPEPAAAGGGPG